MLNQLRLEEVLEATKFLTASRNERVLQEQRRLEENRKSEEEAMRNKLRLEEKSTSDKMKLTEMTTNLAREVLEVYDTMAVASLPDTQGTFALNVPAMAPSDALLVQRLLLPVRS